MVKYSIAFSLLTLVCLTATTHAEPPRFCDPVAIQLQAKCECGTLLPYHFALDRAEDATRAEAKVTQLTVERNELQTQLANLQKQLQQAVAERTKAERERDQAQDEALTAAKVAREQQDQAMAARQAAEVANKARQLAEEIAAKAIAEATQFRAESTQQVAVAKVEVERATEQARKVDDERQQAVADLKRAEQEMAELRLKLDALSSDEKKKVQDHTSEVSQSDESESTTQSD